MPYKIKEYSFKKAKEEDVIIKPSKKKNKKIDVYKDNKYIVSIGDNRSTDYPTYMLEEKNKIKELGYSDKRRKLYYKRHQNEDSKKGTASYYAKKILW